MPRRRRASRRAQPPPRALRLPFVCSWYRTKYPNRCGLARSRPHRHKQSVELGNEQRGARARYGRHAREATIGDSRPVRTPRSGPPHSSRRHGGAWHRRTHRRHRRRYRLWRHDLPILAGQAPAGSAGCERRPELGALRASTAIGKFDPAPCVGQDRVAPVARSTTSMLRASGTLTKIRGSGFVELETLRMGLERMSAILPRRCRIDHCQRALAVTHEHAVALRVDPHVVGIVAKLDAADRREISARSSRTEPSPAFAT